MSDKTPEQVSYEADNWIANDATNMPPWDGLNEGWKERYRQISAAVIAHVRPQIEAEARAAAVEECAQEMDRRSERDRIRANDQTGVVGFGVTASFAACYNDAAKACRAIASAPPGYVCVPVKNAQCITQNTCFPQRGRNER